MSLYRQAAVLRWIATSEIPLASYHTAGPNAGACPIGLGCHSRSQLFLEQVMPCQLSHYTYRYYLVMDVEYKASNHPGESFRGILLCMVVYVFPLDDVPTYMKHTRTTSLESTSLSSLIKVPYPGTNDNMSTRVGSFPVEAVSSSNFPYAPCSMLLI